MNPYYLTDSLGYNFGNGYSSGSGTSSPAGLPVVNGTNTSNAAGNGTVSASTSAPPSGPGSVAAMPTGASASASSAPAAVSATSGPLVHPHQDLNEFLESFWTRQMDGVERETPDFKTYNLPLARIKKVMKSDEEVKMISAEAPIMFSKACEIFISELTCRAWLVAEGHKRRTLQKSDVAAAIAFSDVFDFLIDIVPRDGDEPPATSAAASAAAVQAASNPASNAGSTGPTAAPAQTHVQQQQQQHHPQQHTQHHAQHHGFDDDSHAHAHAHAHAHHGHHHQWQPADGDYDDGHKDVYDGYDEGRDGEALYSEYVQGEGEAFG